MIRIIKAISIGALSGIILTGAIYGLAAFATWCLWPEDDLSAETASTILRMFFLIGFMIGLFAGFGADNKVEEWQPIETAPKDGTHFLGYASVKEDDFYSSVGMAECSYDEYGLSIYATNHYPFAATHWQPLPQPPSTAIKSELKEAEYA